MVEKEKEFLEEDRIRVKENVQQNIVAIAMENPDIEFYVFFPPYSIAYWDDVVRDANLKRIIETQRVAIEQMLPYSNIKVFTFNNQYELLSNLDRYKDTLHYDEETNSQMLQWMKEEQGLLTESNYREYLEEIYSFYHDYDYDALFLEFPQIAF